jgi:hypothetical protein
MNVVAEYWRRLTSRVVGVHVAHEPASRRTGVKVIMTRMPYRDAVGVRAEP